MREREMERDRKEISDSTAHAEADRLPGWPHPRDTAVLFGHDEAERTLLSAYRSGRMHHAWLIQGEEGIGKATLAYRFACFALLNPDPEAKRVMEAVDLAVDRNEPVVRQIHSCAHPDLSILRRESDVARKGPDHSISVDSVRKGLRFFNMTASGGGCRVMIVDTAEDMNINAVNALLKTLEEPPARTVIFLVTHAPGKLPATLRSRCLRLALKPLSDENLTKALDAAGADDLRHALNPDDWRTLLDLARGSVRRALIFLDGGSFLDIWREINYLLSNIPYMDEVRLHRLASTLSRAGGQADFVRAMDFVNDWLSIRLRSDVIRAERQCMGDHLARIAELWEKTHELKMDASIFNFDRKRIVLDVFHSIIAAFD